jgi:2-desacetyl-2-hydroxyethyl bacteriochlorophyllide A dehydrogenase
MARSDGKMMRALVWDGGKYPDGLSVQEVPMPEVKPGWVLVQSKATGICGSDLHYLTGQTRHLVPDKNLPAILGHETAGIVAEIGEGVTNVKVGDRVAVEPLHDCYSLGLDPCPACKSGQYQLCPNLSWSGIPVRTYIPGGYGDYALAHSSRVFKMPESVGMEAAALIDILAVAVHGIKIAKPTMGDTAVVLGCGVIGLDQIQCIKAEGVDDIIAVARYDFQAEIAKKLGAKEVISMEAGGDPIKEVMRLTNGWGVDQVYECVGGDTDAINEGIQMARPGGKVIMLGVFSGNRPVDLLTQLLKEVSILASNSYSNAGFLREYEISVDLLANGRIDHSDFVTHRFSIDDWHEAMETFMHKRQNKCLRVEFIR